MPKLSKEEIEKRRKKMAEEALDSVCARGEVTIKLSPEYIRKAYDIAKIKQQPVGQVMREILERDIDLELDMLKIFLTLRDKIND